MTEVSATGDNRKRKLSGRSLEKQKRLSSLEKQRRLSRLRFGRKKRSGGAKPPGPNPRSRSRQPRRGWRRGGKANRKSRSGAKRARNHHKRNNLDIICEA
ncbi:MAG: hypothetical protein JRF41_09245 [Deltaproteobacteria bacterium]|nr:hypothetical protein [Deltaproteobacteria bacterium]